MNYFWTTVHVSMLFLYFVVIMFNFRTLDKAA